MKTFTTFYFLLVLFSLSAQENKIYVSRILQPVSGLNCTIQTEQIEISPGVFKTVLKPQKKELPATDPKPIVMYKQDIGGSYVPVEKMFIE